MTTIAEPLLLLALNNDKGTASVNQSASLPLSLAGALLTELVMRDRVHVVAGIRPLDVSNRPR